MNKEILESLMGKEVEIFIAPDMPKATGVISYCDDNFIAIGDEIWSYKAILGVRPVKPPRKKTVIPDTATSIPVEHQEVKTEKTETIKTEKAETVKAEQPKSKAETGKAEVSEKPAEPIKLPTNEFTGVLASFYYDHRRWGFIESPEVRKAGVPLRDGEKVFVHLNQITDNVLRKKLLTEKLENPNIDVIFKLTQNQQGIAADNVRTANHVKIGEVVSMPSDTETNAITSVSEEAEALQEANETPESDKIEDDKNSSTAVKQNGDVVTGTQGAEIEEGEIEFYHRYDSIPHGQIRIKGNKLFKFVDSDVVDPLLRVFLEITPNPEGQKVKFIRGMTSKGAVKATHIEAAVPFPDEKIKEWEKSGLLKKDNNKNTPAV